MNKIQKILIGILIAIILFLILGTIITFCSGDAQPGKGLRKTDPNPNSIDNEEVSVYQNIGELRVATADKPQIPIVIEPYFSIDKNDKDFYEEINQKARKIKSIFSEYFLLYTQEELLKKGESSIKNELISLINNELILSKISNLYFKEYIFLE